MPRWNVFEETTIHGIPDIVTSSGHCLRAFFILVFTLGVIASGIYTYNTIQQFIAAPVSSEVYAEQFSILKIPDVILCPFSRFHEERLEKYVGSNEQMNFYLNSLFYYGSVHEYMDLTTNINNLLDASKTYEPELEKILTNKGVSVVDFLSEITYKCEDIVSSCYQGAVSKLGANCCMRTTDVVPVRRVMPYGFCPEIFGMEQKFTGMASGFGIHATLPKVGRAFPGVEWNDGVLFTLVHPTTGLSLDYIQVPLGYQSVVYLRETQTHSINQASRPCRQYPKMENQQVCFQECVMEARMKQCGKQCEPLLLLNTTAHDPSKVTCLGADNLRCTWMSDQAMGNSSEAGVDVCQARCSVACDTAYYERSISFAKLRGPEITFGTNIFNVANLSKSSVIIYLNYANLQVYHTSDFLVMPIESFVANVGGISGLWIGASVLSLVQFPVLVWRAFCLKTDKGDDVFPDTK